MMPAPFWAFVVVIAIVAFLPLLVFAIVLQAMILSALAELFEHVRKSVNRILP